MRHGGIVRDAAVLSAIGIGPDERRRVLGVSVALSEAEVHWRAFLESLQVRGLRGSNTWSPTTTPACAPPAGPCSAARNGSAVSSTSPETRHPSRAEPRDPQAHRRRAARRLERSLSGEGRSRPRRAGRDLPRHRPETRGMAGGERARGPRRLRAARTPPQPNANLKPDGARRPAGARAPHRQGPGLSRRRRPRAPRLRHPRRDRRKMGLRHQGLHQVGIPGCLDRQTLRDWVRRYKAEGLLPIPRR